MKLKIFPFVALILFLAGVGFAVRPSPAFAASLDGGSSSTVTCTMLSVNDPGIGPCGSLDAVGMSSDPAFVQDTESAICIIWHISIDGAHPLDWCAAHMPGRRSGDYILLTSGDHFNEYRITAIQNAQQQLSVQFAQKWTPDGTARHPYLLRLYPGICTDVWSVIIQGSMDPFCTLTMPVQKPWHYVQLAGAGEEGEFIVQAIDATKKTVVIG